jgi:hypothetical protein
VHDLATTWTLNCVRAVDVGHPCCKNIKLLGKCNECKEHEGRTYARSVFRDQKPAAMRDPPLLCYMHYNAGLPTLSHRPTVPNNALRWGYTDSGIHHRSKKRSVYKMLCKGSAPPSLAAFSSSCKPVSKAIVHAPTASTEPYHSLTI